MWQSVEKALLFAAKAHAGQRRKVGDEPYIVHPMAVGWILGKEGCTTDVIVAGLLHDTVEDTSVSLSDIESAFGATVAGWVSMVTEQNRRQPWRTRKEQLLAVIRSAPTEAKYIFCADKLHNLYSMRRQYLIQGNEIWRYFSAGYEDQKWYARSAAEAVFSGTDPREIKPMFFELEQLVGELFSR